MTTARADAGRFAPKVDFARCEGKAACAAVCPYDVFDIRRIEDADFAAQSWITRLKLVVHGRKVAYAPRADACRACGLCVGACPERAIDLVEVVARPA